MSFMSQEIGKTKIFNTYTLSATAVEPSEQHQELHFTDEGELENRIYVD